MAVTVWSPYRPGDRSTAPSSATARAAAAAARATTLARRPFGFAGGVARERVRLGGGALAGLLIGAAAVTARLGVAGIRGPLRRRLGRGAVLLAVLLTIGPLSLRIGSRVSAILLAIGALFLGVLGAIAALLGEVLAVVRIVFARILARVVVVVPRIVVHIRAAARPVRTVVIGIADRGAHDDAGRESDHAGRSSVGAAARFHHHRRRCG